jgi:hypothetical protein
MNASVKAAAVAAQTNKATHILSFAATTPPLGYTTFTATSTSTHAAMAAVAKNADQPPTVSNGMYEITLDWTAMRATQIKNLKSGATAPLNLDWGYYTSNTGKFVLFLPPPPPLSRVC